MEASSGRVHWSVWLLATLLAALRSIPFIFAVTVQNPQVDQIPAGYIPKDFLAYVAVIKHFEHGAPFLENPFTTEPHPGVFILLFHQLLGAVHYVTGANPFWLLELSRWPTTFFLIWAFWYLTARLSLAQYPRVLATWLFAFAGGLHPLVRPFAEYLPETLARRLSQDLWHLYGWSAFESSYNPLWCLGLGLMMLIAANLFLSVPRPKEQILSGLAFAALWFTHIYSAIAVLVATLGVALVEWISLGRFPVRFTMVACRSLAPALVCASLVTMWQLQEPVFRGSSAGFFGTQTPSFFWYPLTYGAVGMLAVLSYSHMNNTARAAMRPVLGWVAGCIWLATSPLLNGYHFVFSIFPPIALLAAPAFGRLLKATRSKKLNLIALVTVVFVSTPVVTVTAVKDALREGQIPPDAMTMVKKLEHLPQGNVLAPPALGNLIPAFTNHHVFVGHWFMTPDFRKRSQEYERALSSCENLAQFVHFHKISYVLVPTGLMPKLTSCFPLLCMTMEVGNFGLIAVPGEKGCP